MTSLLRAATAARPVARALAARAVPVAAAAAASSTVLSARRSLHSSTRPAAASSKAAVWKVDNPYTGEIVAEVPQITQAQAQSLVSQAEQAYAGWRTTTLQQRVQLINKSVANTVQSEE